MSDIINLKFERPKLWIAAGSVGRGLKATDISEWTARFTYLAYSGNTYDHEIVSPSFYYD